MPRKPRLDAKGYLYHIISRGIERRPIFSDDKDRNFFLSRLGEILKETSTPIYAFALIPNHFHLLLRREESPISTVMRKLLTGYALNFNKRHKRSGYLFQNRYKAFICQEDPYLLELIRYIHLNPLRAGQASSLKELATYPFCGHSYLLGKNKSDWFDPERVLIHFGKREKNAIKSYLRFIEDGLAMGKRPDLVGGGLKRSLGYPKSYPKTKEAFDDRILGEGSFVEEIINTDEEKPHAHSEKHTLSNIIQEICSVYGISQEELLGKSKNRNIAKARALLSYTIASKMGLTGSDIARKLSVSRSAVSKMISKGREINNQET